MGAVVLLVLPRVVEGAADKREAALGVEIGQIGATSVQDLCVLVPCDSEFAIVCDCSRLRSRRLQAHQHTFSTLQQRESISSGEVFICSQRRTA